MLEGFHKIYGALSVVPFLPMLVIWICVFAVTKTKKKATQISMDITMLLLIGSVSQMWNSVFKSSFGFGFIVLILAIPFGLIGGYYNRTGQDANLIKAFRIVWRVGFLVLTSLYILFFVIIIANNIA
jgi:hypothetical protein